VWAQSYEVILSPPWCEIKGGCPTNKAVLAEIFCLTPLNCVDSQRSVENPIRGREIFFPPRDNLDIAFHKPHIGGLHFPKPKAQENLKKIFPRKYYQQSETPRKKKLFLKLPKEGPLKSYHKKKRVPFKGRLLERIKRTF